VSQSAASIPVAMSANWKPTPWKRPIGCPNWRRVVAWSRARSMTRRARPTHILAAVIRVAWSHSSITATLSGKLQT
jgi:hypothetical protein